MKRDARLRYRLVEGGMDPAGFRVDQFRQGVGVSPLQLGKGAVLQHLGGDRMILGQFGQDLDISGPAGFGLPALGQLELLEQNLAQLLRRSNIERPTGQFVDDRFQILQLGGHVRRQGIEKIGVDADAGLLHVDQNLQQGHFHVPEQFFLLGFGNHRQQFFTKPQGDVRILGGIDRGFVDVDLLEADPLAAAAGHFRIADRSVAEQFAGQIVQTMGA